MKRNAERLPHKILIAFDKKPGYIVQGNSHSWGYYMFYVGQSKT